VLEWLLFFPQSDLLMILDKASSSRLARQENLSAALALGRRSTWGAKCGTDNRDNTITHCRTIGYSDLLTILAGASPGPAVVILQHTAATLSLGDDTIAGNG